MNCISVDSGQDLQTTLFADIVASESGTVGMQQVGEFSHWLELLEDCPLSSMDD
jgi:hypothetical protein